MIYHAIACYNFELRYRWEHSSIIQQGPRTPRIVEDVALLEGASRALLPAPTDDLRYYDTPRPIFAQRGLLRNEQIKRAKEAGADIVIFADADQVYPPGFFLEISQWLDGPLRDIKRCVSSKRKYVTEKNESQQLVLEPVPADMIIPDAFSRARKLTPIKKRVRNISGGNLQIVRLSWIFELAGGVYVDPAYNRDKDLFEEYQCARSDASFRRRFGDEGYLVDLPYFIHLDHERDKTLGKHLETQR